MDEWQASVSNLNPNASDYDQVEPKQYVNQDIHIVAPGTQALAQLSFRSFQPRLIVSFWPNGLNRYRGKASHQLNYQYPACFL